jgi:hypothetical protein
MRRAGPGAWPAAERADRYSVASRTRIDEALSLSEHDLDSGLGGMVSVTAGRETGERSAG